MDIYLTIITTALVLTQIIRLIQNSKQLKHVRRLNQDNDRIMLVWKKVEQAVDKYIKQEAD